MDFSQIFTSNYRNRPWGKIKRILKNVKNDFMGKKRGRGIIIPLPDFDACGILIIAGFTCFRRHVKFRVEGIEVLTVQVLLHNPQAFTETGRLK